MPITLNHTIVYSSDKQKGAEFLTDLFGLPPASAWGPFATVQLANDPATPFSAADYSLPCGVGLLLAQLGEGFLGFFCFLPLLFDPGPLSPMVLSSECGRLRRHTLQSSLIVRPTVKGAAGLLRRVCITVPMTTRRKAPHGTLSDRG